MLRVLCIRLNIWESESGEKWRRMNPRKKASTSWTISNNRSKWHSKVTIERNLMVIVHEKMNQSIDT